MPLPATGKPRILGIRKMTDPERREWELDRMANDILGGREYVEKAHRDQHQFREQTERDLADEKRRQAARDILPPTVTPEKPRSFSDHLANWMGRKKPRTIE